jgi:hypothetical protein
MIPGKEESKCNGKVFRERELGREEQYIQTQNDTRRGAMKNNGKVFRETRVKQRSVIQSDRMILGKEQARKMGNSLEKRGLRREE